MRQTEFMKHFSTHSEHCNKICLIYNGKNGAQINILSNANHILKTNFAIVINSLDNIYFCAALYISNIFVCMLRNILKFSSVR